MKGANLHLFHAGGEKRAPAISKAGREKGKRSISRGPFLSGRRELLEIRRVPLRKREALLQKKHFHRGVTQRKAFLERLLLREEAGLRRRWKNNLYRGSPPYRQRGGESYQGNKGLRKSSSFVRGGRETSRGTRSTSSSMEGERSLILVVTARLWRGTSVEKTSFFSWE